MHTLGLEFANARERERYRSRLRWRQRGSSAVLVVLSLPSTVLGGMIVARLGGLLGHWGMVVSLTLWLLLGVPILYCAAMTNAKRPPSKCGEWTSEQIDRIVPAWLDVAEAAGVHEPDYVLAIDKSPDVQGHARGRWIVEASEGAVQQLRENQLQALLAHELGHLLSSRRGSWKILIGWYAVPLYLATIPLCVILAIPGGLARADGPVRKLVVNLAWMTGVAAMPAMLVLLFGPWHALLALTALAAQQLAKMLLARRDERMADLIAVDLGFADGLLAYLREYGSDACIGRTARPGERPVARFFGAPLSTHPSVRRRIRAIESRMASREQDRNR